MVVLSNANVKQAFLERNAIYRRVLKVPALMEANAFIQTMVILIANVLMGFRDNYVKLLLVRPAHVKMKVNV